MYFQDAVAAIVVYDMTDKKSLDAAREWIVELKNHSNDDIIVALIGNKCDAEEEREVNL